MNQLNKYLCQYLLDDSFVTADFVAIEPRNGETEAVNMGYLPPIVFEASGVSRRLRSAQMMPLGITSSVVAHDRMEATESLVLFTDGLTEIRSVSGRMLGLYGLASCIVIVFRLSVGESYRESVKELNARLESLRGDVPASDDRTLLVARRKVDSLATMDMVGERISAVA